MPGMSHGLRQQNISQVWKWKKGRTTTHKHQPHDTQIDFQQRLSLCRCRLSQFRIVSLQRLSGQEFLIHPRKPEAIATGRTTFSLFMNFSRRMKHLVLVVLSALMVAHLQTSEDPTNPVGTMVETIRNYCSFVFMSLQSFAGLNLTPSPF